MRITLVGSRHFGVTTLNMLKAHGVEIARVVVHDAEDRLAAAAKAAGIEVAVQKNPKLVVASEIGPNTDLIVTAHSHARSREPPHESLEDHPDANASDPAGGPPDFADAEQVHRGLLSLTLPHREVLTLFFLEEIGRAHV